MVKKKIIYIYKIKKDLIWRIWIYDGLISTK